MKDRQDSSYADDWLSVARRDWHRIHVMLVDGDADGAGFFLQQALEKYLKAFLLRRGWKLKKVHTLQSLLDEASALAPDLTSLRPVCERVSGFYIGERYPSIGAEGLQLEDINRELPEARLLISKLCPDEQLE
ncbi:MAG: HEPN domain-containing protein [Nitrospirota bacterium]|nr:HEPN domain-containing protein [Nitrospirota bacterium]